MSILSADVPRAFLPLLSPKRYKAAHGGRGSGKSHFFGEQLIIKAYAQPIRAVCIREVQNTIRDSVRQLLIDKIAKFGLGAFFDPLDTEIRGKNGSLIIFKGMQHYNAESIKSLEGFDIAWVEEAQTFSEKSLRMLRPTIRKPESELWFSWNPRHDFDPVDEFFRGKNRPGSDVSTCIEVNWHDNPWFPDVLAKEKEADYAKDPLMAQNIWEGAYEIITVGSYYATLLQKAEVDNRITHVPYEPRVPVYTAWDLGVDDVTSIWFFQHVGLERHVIDYYENSGKGFDHYAAVLKNRDWAYGAHYLPHDIEVREISTARSRLETLRGFEIGRIETVPREKVEEGIEAVRTILPSCWFDKEKCKKGLEALRSYRTDFDDLLLTFKPRPLHNWASHAADAFRYYAQGHRPVVKTKSPKDFPTRRLA